MVSIFWGAPRLLIDDHLVECYFTDPGVNTSFGGQYIGRQASLFLFRVDEMSVGQIVLDREWCTHFGFCR